jgi:formylglycine-generating enzyme required for sulfatase activity
MKVVHALALACALGLAWWWTASSARGNAAGERMVCLPNSTSGASTDLHDGMVWVPAGSFDLGDEVYPEEQPVRRVTVRGFWMDRTEVTNRQFAAFVAATGHVTTAERPVDTRSHPNLPHDMRQPGAVVFTPPQASDSAAKVLEWWRYTPGASWRHPGGPQTDLRGREDFPVVNVTFEDASAYARWKGRELPSESQWEWAARAGNTGEPGVKDPPAQANTWQGLFPVLNSADDGFVGLAPVGCYTANAFGLHDMIGNVWELTADMYRPHHGDEAPDASDAPSRVPMALRAAATGTRVIKGGSYLCAPNYCLRYRPGARQPQEEDLAVSHLGFRTVTKGSGS